jgi:hypothetical protein
MEVNTMKHDSEKNEDKKRSAKELSWLDRWIERLFGDENWKHYPQGCISYPFCYF